MSHLDILRILNELSMQLFRKEPLSDQQSEYLCLVFMRIANGEDANIVLGTRPKRGNKNSDAIARERLSFILQWIACKIESHEGDVKNHMSIEKACELAIDSIVPFAKFLFPGAEDCNYDVEYLMRCWSEPKYKHMRSTKRQLYDEDFPFQAD